MNTFRKTIKLPSEPLTITLKSPSTYYDNQTKNFFMYDSNGDRLIPVTFNGSTATIPAIEGKGKLTICFFY